MATQAREKLMEGLTRREREKAKVGESMHPALAEIFEEVPVSLDDFISNSEYLGAEWTLSDIQYEAVRHIERVYFEETYKLLAEHSGIEYWEEQLPVKNIITLEWGKGSGKDHICRIASLRVAYLLLCLHSPQRYFKMPEQDSIHLLNIAVNAAQAERAFFTPLKQAVRRGWFAGKARVSRDTIIYKKNIIAISGHSDAESQEGLNIMLGIADEIDAFREQSEMVGLGNRKREASTSAESILKMLKGSASTRFPKTYKRVAISYPRYIGSTIQQQLAEAKLDIETYGDENSIYYYSGPYATWDVNPRISGKEDFISDYRKDPIEAASMYECRPARAVDGYFKNMAAVKAAVDSDYQPITVEYKYEPLLSDKTGNTTMVWNAEFTISPDFKPVQGARYAMHGDLAIKGDRAGIAMSHIVRYIDTTVESVDSDGRRTLSNVRKPIIRNDFTIAFEADIAAVPPREIQIRWAGELAFKLIDLGFHIVLYSFDQFQSADLMQQLNDHGIETDRISADINENPYKSLRDVAYDGRLHMPDNELLFDELERLNRLGNGKVDHPPGGSKDLADALACSVVGAISSMGEESVDGREVNTSSEKFEVGQAMAPLAGMGTTDMRHLMPVGMERMKLYG